MTASIIRAVHRVVIASLYEAVRQMGEDKSSLSPMTLIPLPHCVATTICAIIERVNEFFILFILFYNFIIIFIKY